jgi:hypothetical protein
MEVAAWRMRRLGGAAAWRESSGLEARGGKREREIFVFFILFN